MSTAAVRRLGVLGTPVWDTIWTEADRRRGVPFESWGGITYALAAASATLPPGWEIVPLVKVGADLAAEFDALLRTLPGIALANGAITVPEANNRVELTYRDAARRGERQSGALPGWRMDELAPLLRTLDALYVNFISGAELDLETAEALRGAFAPMYADLHSLFLGCANAAPRRRRRLPEWERWARCFDVVQLNEEELATLAEPSEATRATLRRVRNAGPALVATTLGARGARLLGRWAGSAVDAAIPTDVAAEGDTTGCGDVWGATFYCRLLAGDAPVAAARAAHALARRKLSHRGAAGLREHLASAPRPV